MTRFTRLVALTWLTVGTLSACVSTQAPFDATPTAFHAVIRRTQDGIPHIEAKDWASLGYGYGYVQAQDNLCTLAEGFVTYRGKRSAYFGADDKPDTWASFGQPRNLDADFFFRLVDDSDAVRRYRAAQSPRLQQLIEGFAAGYNRYLETTRASPSGGAHADCINQPWVERITADDIYRRLIAANYAAGYAPFLAQIVSAQPPALTPASPSPSTPATVGAVSIVPPVWPHQRKMPSAQQTAQITLDPRRLEVGGQHGIGSNGMAFGASVTNDGRSLLFGNPHWFLRGPDRFYEAQLTIPGELNVAGASFLGVPVIVIGFNNDIAWTHTVSSAHRFGLFELKLDPSDPTRYIYDGVSTPMTRITLSVDTRQTDGTIKPVVRTFYASRFGPLLDLSSMSPALAWDHQHAFAIRDANADNLSAFENFLSWDQARSLDDFIAIQKRLAATPWVNTMAIGRGDRRAWFADWGALPNVPDALAASCTTPLGKAFDAKMPGVPFLDGSMSRCEWRTDTDSVRTGALPVSAMPSAARTDYVANFNGSYWLTNPSAPMTGYPAVAGIAGTAQSLRTRLGHETAAALQAQPGGVSRESLETAVLSSHSMSEALFRQPILDAVCHEGGAVVESGSPVSIKTRDGVRSVDLHRACDVLQAWDGTGNTAARGANLWDEMWGHIEDGQLAAFYRQPFDPHAPLSTPSGLDAQNPALLRLLRQALAQAVLAMQDAGFPLDAPRGALLYTERQGVRIPLFGGCDDVGYLTVMCAVRPLDKSGYRVDIRGHGASYLQVVSFDAQGVQADTMLSHSESDDPRSSHFADATKRFAAKQWLRFPFTATDIAAETKTTEVLQTPR